MLKKIRNNLFLAVRIALVISAAVNIVIGLSGNNQENIPETVTRFSKNIEAAFFAKITLILTFGPDIIEKREKIDIPDILEIIIVLFIFAGIFISVQFNLYYTFFWWDDLLHTISGVIIGFLGFILVYKLNYKYSMNLNPLLVAVFSFTYAVTLGVIWEILEFLMDVLVGSAHQKWDLPETEIMIGKPYQGSGLRDTMSDLIVDSIGAFITSTITYYMYKYQRKRTLEEMSKMIVKDNESSESKKRIEL
jgi:hypothetical protein